MTTPEILHSGMSSSPIRVSSANITPNRGPIAAVSPCCPSELLITHRKYPTSRNIPKDPAPTHGAHHLRNQVQNPAVVVPESQGCSLYFGGMREPTRVVFTSQALHENCNRSNLNSRISDLHIGCSLLAAQRLEMN